MSRRRILRIGSVSIYGAIWRVPVRRGLRVFTGGQAVGTPWVTLYVPFVGELLIVRDHREAGT